MVSPPAYCLENNAFRDLTYSSGRPSIQPDRRKVLDMPKCGPIHPHDPASQIIHWDNALEALLDAADEACCLSVATPFEARAFRIKLCNLLVEQITLLREQTR